MKLQDYLNKLAWYDELSISDKVELVEELCMIIEQVEPYTKGDYTRDEQFKMYEAVCKENDELKSTLLEIKKLINKYAAYDWPQP